ncbi:MAG: 50S ribosomal protein L21 [Clostridia bacterium]|nr:50S ribosomal protein L21 [Clostridia bacterium]
MYAVIEAGGKQYKVAEGDVIFVEKMGAEDGAEVSFDRVMLVGDENGVKVGAPTVDGAKVSGKVLRNGKGKKIYVLTYKPKKNEKRKLGHRQPYTKVEITKIEA